MFLCRSTRLTLSHLARKSPAGFCRNVVPRRPMSSGVPGGSGEHFVYFALCGASLTAGLAYAYRTVTEDRTRYNDRVTELQARPKDEWQSKPWPPKGGDDAESEAEEEGGDEGEETPAGEAVAVEDSLEAADGSEVAEPALAEAEPALAEAEPVSVETVNEPSGADLEAALAEAMEEALVEGAPASAESDVLTPAMLNTIQTVSEVEGAESVGIPASCVGEVAEMLEDVPGQIMELEAEEPVRNQMGTVTGPNANLKDLMGVTSERESVMLADTPTASTEEEKSVVVQLVPEAKEASSVSVAEMSLVEDTARATGTEEESVVEEPVSSEEPAADTTAEGSEVNVEKEASTEFTVAAVEDPEVFLSNVEPVSTSKEEPAPDSAVGEPAAIVEEEARDETEAKDYAATIAEEPEVLSYAEEPASTSKEEPAPDSTAEGPVASLEDEPAEAPTEFITLEEVKIETLHSSIHPPEKIPENKTAAAGPDNLTEETLSSKDEFSQVVEAEISPEVEVQSSLEAMKIEANPIMGAAETEGEDHPAVPAEMCPIVENSEPLLNTTVPAEEVAQKPTEKAEAQLTGTEMAEPKRTPANEYVVVVLEGAPKEPKKPKVLGIVPTTASISSPKGRLLEVKDP
ncbi:proteoglycan 4 [Brienomyrus brachyistius]|uniref:proteoglycan 4 n=1 Tax=Brienomyrus brachyistius TaxID=42636 RepID=UPI0020B304AB|nr:proteoglycan 4 [Brienomyrus brachyistius]